MINSSTNEKQSIVSLGKKRGSERGAMVMLMAKTKVMEEMVVGTGREIAADKHSNHQNTIIKYS